MIAPISERAVMLLRWPVWSGVSRTSNTSLRRSFMVTSAARVSHIVDGMRRVRERLDVGNLERRLVSERDLGCLRHHEMGLNPGIAEEFKQTDTVCHSRRSGDSDDQASLRWVHDRIPKVSNAPETGLREGRRPLLPPER